MDEVLADEERAGGAFWAERQFLIGNPSQLEWYPRCTIAPLLIREFIPMATSAPTGILDALVVGAGPAGIGTALALDAVEGLVYGVVERGDIGETFLRWPNGQHFLTPSFTGNGFGATDLNSVHPDTSPAFSLGVDYPGGADYARYLRGVATHFSTPILRNTDVTSITTSGGLFTVQTTNGPVQSRTVIWAGGEFQTPIVPRMAGSGEADHSSEPSAWAPRDGALVIIGGYESGIDLAVHHVMMGTSVTVIDENHPWDALSGSDPSFRLSPRTRQRLAEAQKSGRLTLSSAGRVTGIRPNAAGDYSVAVAGSNFLQSDTRPILATGYGHGLGPAAGLFELRADGWPLLDDNDQSTITPGMYLAGAAIRHGGLKFCFIYKFRQRFAHVAHVIGTELGKNVDALEAWRAAGMLTDDLSCCGVECAC